MEQTFTQLAGEDLSMIKRRNAEQTAVTQHGDLDIKCKNVWVRKMMLFLHDTEGLAWKA